MLEMPKLLKLKQLSPRLAKIAALVRSGASVCDVGTDHAFIPCHLARRGDNPVIYASDINPGPLNAAKSEVEHKGAADAVTLLLSDGLKDVPPCDDVIIAGMGGELIAEIIGGMPDGFKTANLRLILQPMTKADVLRQALSQYGFEIISEERVREERRQKRLQNCRQNCSQKCREYLILYCKGISAP